MKASTLKFISDALESLGINYDLMDWKGKPKYPYFVGEYQETPIMNESGLEESTFILYGYSRTTHFELEEIKEKIATFFPKREGKTVTAEDGTVVTIFYNNAIPLRTADAELKKIQINLDVKEWSVN